MLTGYRQRLGAWSTLFALVVFQIHAENVRSAQSRLRNWQLVENVGQDALREDIQTQWRARKKSQNENSNITFLEPIRKLRGDEAIVVFYDYKQDRIQDPIKLIDLSRNVLSKRENLVNYLQNPSSSSSSSIVQDTVIETVVSFDIETNSQCVVSICGWRRTWYLHAKEECFDFRVAPKGDQSVIRDISAAFTSARPVADRLYLKFDATNFFDGSVCEYKILKGTKLTDVIQ